MEKITALPVPKDAYNPSRQMSSLLQSQVQILQQAVVDAIDTEAEAALCIRTLTGLLRKLRPQIQPRAYSAAAPTKRSKARATKRAAKPGSKKPRAKKPPARKPQARKR